MLPLPSISTKPQPSVISSGSMDISTTSPSAPSGNPLILPSINDSPGSDISDVEMDQSPPEPETNITASSSRSPPLNSAEQDVVQQEASSSSFDAQEDEEDPYSIRLTPFIDHSSTTPALYINSVERKAHDGLVIRVGRYTEKKESPPPKPEHAPIVFKSKVVSRSHAQLNVKDGQWFVQDVKSSSGTFLNHVRLSPACQQSQPYALKDGDILQLGMDFRGGSEEIYKCIKVRVEVNRSWQKRVNNFNVNALSNLRNICSLNTKELQECAICLLPVAPCQALFIAPCTHAWHYKCIRPLVIKSYPHFLCPNCRAMCDLEAEIETPDLSHLQQIAAEAESSANTS